MELTITLVGVFAVFIPALLLPGPDFIAVVRSSMTNGTGAGLRTTLGVSLGLAFYATLSLLGLSAVLMEFQWLTWLVRAIGGLYLMYLGIRLMRTRADVIDIRSGASDRGNPLVFGFLVTLTNPKAIVLFASVFATAVSPTTPVWFLGLMVALVFASALVWYTVVSLFMSSAPVMKQFQNARHWIERGAGVCFIGIGGKILSDARNPVTP